VGPLEPTPWGAPVSDLPPLPVPDPAPADAPAPAAPAAAAAAAVPAAAGAGVPAPAPAGGAVAAAAAKATPVTGLAAPATVAAATAARAGIVVRLAVPAGVKTAAIRVLRQRGPKLAVLGSQVVRVKRGVNRIALNGKALRRKLARGRVIVEVRLRRANGLAGAPKRAVVRIV
jgi:hypothetical protein